MQWLLILFSNFLFPTSVFIQEAENMKYQKSRCVCHHITYIGNQGNSSYFHLKTNISFQESSVQFGLVWIITQHEE